MCPNRRAGGSVSRRGGRGVFDAVDVDDPVDAGDDLLAGVSNVSNVRISGVPPNR